MSIPLIVNGNTFDYPEEGSDPSWGEEATGWAQEVTIVLSSLLGVDDIIQTSFNIANNQAVAANITGLIFNTTTVRLAIVEYSIYRHTTTNEAVEGGNIYAIYKNDSATWELAKYEAGDGGVTISITNTGQFQYVSTNLAGASYTGVIHFRARVLNQ